MPTSLNALYASSKRAIKQHLYPDSIYIRQQYRYRTGLELDLRDPKDLAEKVQWLKLHDRSPLHTLCADKIRVRDYVAAQLGPEYLVPLLYVTHDPADLTPENIPAERFVVKTNHDQGGVFICKDRAGFDWAGMRAEVARRLATNKYPEFREYQYKAIRPGALVEAFIEGDNGGNNSDLKFYCFHGKPAFVMYVRDRFENFREIFVDPDWNRLPFRGPGAQPPPDETWPRPACFDRLLQAASVLSAPFLYCRIDFLLSGDEALFGEVTFHHGAGLIRFEPPEFERAFGDLIDLRRLAETRAMQNAIYDRLTKTASPPV